MEISVNVSHTGYYRIATDLQNGVMLADSGDFTRTGLNMVRLKATGSFVNSAVTNFTVTFDTTACQFSINVQDTLADNTWKFTARGHVYKGPAVANYYNLPQHIGSELSIAGHMASGSQDTTMYIDVSSTHGGVVTGTSPTTRAGLASFQFNTSTYPIFQANVGDPSPQVVYIDITSVSTINISDTRVTGTFNGTAADSAGATVPITNSSFNVIVQIYAF